MSTQPGLAAPAAGAAGLPAALRPLGASLGPVLARWRQLAPRERVLVQVAGAAIAFGLLWMVAVQPAWTTLRTAPSRIDALDADLQRMRRLATETRELRAAPAVSTAQANLALKSATDRLGAAGQLVIQGDRATLTLTAARPDALRAWLAEARGAARARPIEMRLSQSGAGYSGTLVVALGGNP
jgi:general secretion pathway protein M